MGESSPVSYWRKIRTNFSWYALKIQIKWIKFITVKFTMYSKRDFFQLLNRFFENNYRLDYILVDWWIGLNAYVKSNCFKITFHCKSLDITTVSLLSIITIFKQILPFPSAVVKKMKAFHCKNSYKMEVIKSNLTS